MSELAALVADNDKQRFSLIAASQTEPDTTSEAPTDPVSVVQALGITDSSDPADYLIRANQGHSLKVESDGLLTQLSLDDSELPKTVVHGTNRRAWPLIASSGGLKTMGRNHVHFATGLPSGFKPIDADGAGSGTTDAGEEVPVVDAPVISGMRVSSTVLVYVDLEKAMKSGLNFWRSDNGVILTDGGEAGIVPLEFFKLVEERGENGGILVKDGLVLKQLSGKDRSSGKDRRKP